MITVAVPTAALTLVSSAIRATNLGLPTNVLASFIFENSAGVGQAISTIAISILNRRRQVQDQREYVITGGLPNELALVQLGALGIGYEFRYPLDFDAFDFPPDFVMIQYRAVLASGASIAMREVSVNFAEDGIIAFDDGMYPYLTLTRATAMMARSPFTNHLAQCGVRKQLQLLYEASNDVDSEGYKGVKSVSNYGVLDAVSAEGVSRWIRRQFPRTIPEFGLTFEPSTDLDDDIPMSVRQATLAQANYLAEIAAHGMSPDGRRDLQRAGVTSSGGAKTGEQFALERRPHNSLCVRAAEFLAPYLKTSAHLSRIW